MITELMFEIGGEGGGICIYRQKSKSEEKFLYDHSEFDPTEEGLDINEKGVYQNFEKPFQLINNKYPWYSLYIVTVHNDYRKFIIDKLIEKLNGQSIAPDGFGYSKDQLERILKIELKCKPINNKPIWSYRETDE